MKPGSNGRTVSNLGKLEPGVYANGGFFALPKELGTAFFTTFARCLDRVEPSETDIDTDAWTSNSRFFTRPSLAPRPKCCS